MPFFSVVLEICDDGCLSPFPHWGPRKLQFWFCLSNWTICVVKLLALQMHGHFGDTLEVDGRSTALCPFILFFKRYCFLPWPRMSTGAITLVSLLVCHYEPVDSDMHPMFSSVSCFTSSTLQWSQFWFTVILWVSSDISSTGLQFIV